MQTPLRLDSVFTSHMVLQRRRGIAIAGSAEALAEVTAEIGGGAGTTRADASGRFVVELPAMEAGGPHELVVRSGGHEVRLGDVLIGEVWLTSGQSNMEWVTSLCDNAEAELRDVDYPELRVLFVPRVTAGEPQRDVAGIRWQRVSSEAVREFTGIGFFFGRRLVQELGVPVGVIGCSWGGTTAEAWTPLGALRTREELTGLAGTFDRGWKREMPPPHVDPGISAEAAGWGGWEVGEEEKWGEMRMPSTWQSSRLYHNGAVWFRKEIELPAGLEGEAGELSLGVVDDMDVTFVNGVEVGRTGAETPGFWAVRRKYQVPAGVLRAGRNVVAVRVFDQWGAGGMLGPGEVMKLDVRGEAVADLRGDWRYRVELELEQRWPGGSDMVQPTALYNAMLHPLTGMKVAGALWYQGESNCGRAEQYRVLLPTMISAWREAFGDEMPFYVVQLANFGPKAEMPAESDWAELREAQWLATRALPRVYLASAVDVGDADDIHPRDKQTVARRLAEIALCAEYGREGPCAHPTLSVASFRGYDGGWTVRLELENATGLHSRSDRVEGFAVADESGKFVWAEAEFEGAPGPGKSPAVLLRCAEVARPTAVRYGWAGNPPLSLFNGAGWPVLPFRTDDFPMMSAGLR
jgi:sialate O-acetylesterase